MFAVKILDPISIISFSFNRIRSCSFFEVLDGRRYRNYESQLKR